jgi:uncharacterized protein
MYANSTSNFINISYNYRWFGRYNNQNLLAYNPNDEYTDLDDDYAYKLSAGHCIIILIRDTYPINVLPRLKEVPELVNIYYATANPIEVIFIETE